MEEEYRCCCRYWFSCCHIVLNWVGCYESCWLSSWLLGRLDVVSWLCWNRVNYCRNISCGRWWGIIGLVDIAASVPLVVVSGIDQVIIFVEPDWVTALPCCDGYCKCCWPARWLLGRLCVVSWLCWDGSDIRTASIIAPTLLLVRGVSLSIWFITVSAAWFVLFSIDQVVLFEEPDWVAVLSSLWSRFCC